MKLLGLDVGSKRIGVARTDALGLMAHPVDTIERRSELRAIAQILEHARGCDASEIIIGLPRNMNGSLGPAAEKIQCFGDQLIDAGWDRPIVYWDERWSTQGSERHLLEMDVSREKRKQVIDKLAAQWILEGYLQYLKKKEKDKMTQIKSRTIQVAPSILSADFSKLGEEIRCVDQAGADIIHVDVMDGHFVPNLTIGPIVVKALRAVTRLPLDVHLMIDSPEKYIDDFAKAGSDWITIHYEACTDQSLSEVISQIKKAGKKAGVSLKPGTSIDKLKPFLDEIDLILIMTVEPGFGGQSFMPAPLEKIREIRESFQGLISVDGGIAGATATLAREAGADILVAGTAVFGQKDRAAAIRNLRTA